MAEEGCLGWSLRVAKRIAEDEYRTANWALGLCYGFVENERQSGTSLHSSLGVCP